MTSCDREPGSQDDEVVRALRTDETSWSAIERGDVEYVVRRHWQPVYRYLRTRLPSTAAAEDATQDFFLDFVRRRIVERLDRQRGSCRQFIYHMARQFLIDLYRKEDRRKHAEAPRGIGDALDEIASDSPTPEEDFDRQWFVSLLDQARRAVKQTLLGRGRPAAYSAFKLYYWSEQSTPVTQADIARELGLPVTQVNNYIDRARKLYAQALRELVGQTCASSEVEAELAKLVGALEGQHVAGPPPSTFLQLPGV